MATTEEFERNCARADREYAERKQNTIKTYGEKIGKALFNYVEEGSDKQKNNFAKILVTIFENGTHEEKIMGMVALLSSIEDQIEPVAQKAQKAVDHNARY